MPDPNEQKAGSGTAKVVVDSGKERETPLEILNQNFTTEQLPELNSSEGGPASTDMNGKPVSGEVKKEELKLDNKEKIEEKLEEKKEEKKEVKEEKKEEEVKVDDKKEDDASRFLKPPNGKEVEKKGSKDTFDYSGYSDQQQSILKNMPKENREIVGKMIKELSTTKEAQYYQHPNAYVLHPGYQAELQTVNWASEESNIWAKLLDDVKFGKPVKVPVDRVDGKIVYSAEIPASSQLEEAIRANVLQCSQIVTSKRKELQNFASNFQSITNRDIQAINQERQKRFAWVADPKLLEYSVSTTDGDKPIKQIRQDVINLFPPYLRHSMPAEVCGDLMVALIIAKAENNELKNGKKVDTVKKEEERHIEPSSETKPRKLSEPTHGVRNFSLDAIPGVEL